MSQYWPITLIQKSHNSKNFNLFDLTGITNLFPDFAYVKWIIITSCFCFSMSLRRIFPCLIHDKLMPTLKTRKKFSDLPEGKHHNSRYNHGEGNNCGHNEVCLFYVLFYW